MTFLWEVLLVNRTNYFLDKAKRLRPIIEKTAVSLPDEEALQAPEIFPLWKTGTSYAVNDRVQYNGVLYKVLQAHTSQATWTPDAAVSLFAKVLIPETDKIPEWEQPGSTNPYMKGDRVKYNGKTYESTIDNNVWAPGVYGWKEV